MDRPAGGIQAPEPVCDAGPAVRFPMAFELELAHGLCVGVRIPADIDELPVAELAQLDAEEQRYAGSLRKLRQLTWVAGRVAMHRALDQLGVPAAAVLPNDRGAPILPRGVVGSISHKRTLAVAMVADSSAAPSESISRSAGRPAAISPGECSPR